MHRSRTCASPVKGLTADILISLEARSENILGLDAGDAGEPPIAENTLWRQAMNSVKCHQCNASACPHNPK
ncbi:hypothetical protein M405DRAFT_236766 [Rhizopogon salebrosus TDB-379]|nr:hypothetical protein M405DRAFT_236766 [Rhizopogon salebrosus TDB-379]